MLENVLDIPGIGLCTPIWAISLPSSPTRLPHPQVECSPVHLVHRDAAHRQQMRAQVNTVFGGVALTDQVVEVLRDRIPYILFGTVFLFIGLCVCGIAVMRRQSGGKFFTWLGIWSAIEGTEYLFGSLADLGLLPNWLLASLPYVGNILSFSVVVIALLAFLDLSQDKLRLFLRGAIVAGLAIAVAGIALFLFTGSSFKIMPYNHLLAAVSLTVLAIVVAVPKLCRRFLVLPNRTVLSLGILLFALEAVYGNLSLPLRLPSPPEILDPLGFAVLLFCFGYVAVQNVGFSDIRARF
jgi:hypothetical protein